MGNGVARRLVAVALVLAFASACSASGSHGAGIAVRARDLASTGANAWSAAPTGDVANVAPETFTGEAPTPAPPPRQLTAAAVATTSSTALAGAGGVWAVIVGIDDYPGTNHDLRLAGSDATAMDAALGRYGVPADRRLRLASGAASAANLRRSLQWLVAHGGPDATAVFFYAGHVRKVRGHEAMVGSDGALVFDTEVADLLRPLRARRTWLVMAACYGGGFNEALRPGVILTAAASANQLAYENTEVGHSYLVEYLVQRAMLEGKADGSVERAYAWAYESLRREHPDRLPVQFDDAPGELDLRMGPIAPPTPPPPPPTTTTTTPPPTTTTTQPKQRCLITLTNANCR